MHEKLNNARIMCNHLKYKHSIKEMWYKEDFKV